MEEAKMTNSTDVRGTELAALRAIVADETKPLTERTDAAALFVQLTADSITEPADDNPEVIELCKPWHGTESDRFLAEIVEQVGGRPIAGWSLPSATAQVFKRHRERAVLAMVVDTSLPRLIRLAAVSNVRDGLNSRNDFITNSINPEQMLNRITSPDTSRLYTTSGDYDKRPVARPPRDLGDVWQS